MDSKKYNMLTFPNLSKKTLVVTVHNEEQKKFLHKKTHLVDFASVELKELRRAVRDMRFIVKTAKGIGLSANQVGIDLKFFVAEVPVEGGGKPKFYAIFNPQLVHDKEIQELEEGCLSVPGVTGLVERSKKVVLSGFDVQGKPIRIKAWGLLAHIFQHEVDHLNGHLFIDKAKKIYEEVKDANEDES